MALLISHGHFFWPQGDDSLLCILQAVATDARGQQLDLLKLDLSRKTRSNHNPITSSKCGSAFREL